MREVYITLPLGSQPRIVELLEQLQGTTASLFFVPDVFGISIIQGRLQDMNGVPVVGICETPFTGTNELVKRISDVVIASIILVLISPLLLAIAIGVKLSSPGPVLFKQRRNGLDGHEIVVYKFRSMRTMDDGDVVRQATRNDPRVTPFGAFLRRTSFDELPQFFNVLRGTMSIVGPRPHAVTHNKEYRQIIKAYMVRHKVKPGITGWAQVNGQRGETDTVEKMRTRVEYDLEYLRNWSLALDLKIIAAPSACCSSIGMRTERLHVETASSGSRRQHEQQRSKPRAGARASCDGRRRLGPGGGAAGARRRTRPRLRPRSGSRRRRRSRTPTTSASSQGFTHDSNVYRIPSGPSDNYSSTSVFGGFDQPISRQRVFGRAQRRA